MSNKPNIQEALRELGIQAVNPGVCTGINWIEPTGDLMTSYSPVDGNAIAAIRQATLKEYDDVVKRAAEAFRDWKMVPAPRRGEIVRLIGLELRKYKEPLGILVSWEMGKILQE